MEEIANLEKLEKEISEREMVLVYFGNETCGVCVDLKPKLEKVLEKFPNIKAYQVDAHADRKLSAKFQVFTIPVVLLYVEGKETIREARHMSIYDLEDKIDRYYQMLFN